MRSVSQGSNDQILLGALVTVTDLLLTEVETRALMDRMVGVAAQVLPAVAAASVTVRDGDVGSTLAASHDAALLVDQAQYDGDDGPCLRALRTGEEVHVTELATAEWPIVAEAAARAELRSSLSVPMRNGELLGVLNLYGAHPGSFADEAARANARIFARYAATIGVAHTRFHHAVAEVEQLHQALESRAVIEQAKGMIMLRERCNADDAFQLLVRTSQHSHLKLRDIASSLVASVGSSEPKPGADE